MNKVKERTRTFTNIKTDKPKKSQNYGYSPEKSEGRSERYNQDLYKIRFRRKDLESF